jgi:chromosome segregation ATPase
MSDVSTKPIDSIEPETPKGKRKNRASALDFAFPPVWVMGVSVLLVVLMTVLSGWKIVNLEYERAGVNAERKLLEHDKQTYYAIHQELPVLEKRHQDLTREVSDLTGKVQSERTVMESLAIQKDAVLVELEKAKAEAKETQEAAQAARNTFAALQSDIQVKRPQAEQLKLEVQLLQTQTKTLSTTITDLQNQVSSAKADISGLDKQKENSKLVLEQMTQDTGQLQVLSGRFNTVANELEAALNDPKKGLTKELKNAVGAVDTQAQGLSTYVHTVSQDSGNFKMIVKSAGQQVESLTQTLDDPQNGLKSGVSAVTNTVGTLGKTVTTLDGNVGMLQTKINGVDSAIGGLQKATADLSQARVDMSNDISVVKILVGQAKVQLDGQTGALPEIIKTIEDKLSSVASRLDRLDEALQAIEQRARQVSGGQTNQQHSEKDSE